jgi:hypothetical protein
MIRVGFKGSIGGVVVLMVLTLIVVLVGCGGSDSTSASSSNRGDDYDEDAYVAQDDVTQLKITNTSSSPVTIGFKTNATGGVCTDADQLVTAEELANQKWCSGYIAGVDSAGQCTLTLDAAGGDNDSTTVPNSDGKCLAGVFGVGGYAACSTVTYPYGWTQGEFTLNPIESGAQETVDISGVNGFNYELSIHLESGWTYGPDVTSISTVGPNRGIGKNVGNPGVFPSGCTDCIQLVGTAPCPELASNPKCNSTRICNVQHTTGDFGGTVEFKIGDLMHHQ